MSNFIKTVLPLFIIFVCANSSFTGELQKELQKFNWDSTMDENINNKEIRDKADNVAIVSEKVLGRNADITYLFDNEKLVEAEIKFPNFATGKEREEFESILLETLLKDYIIVNTIEDMYDNYKFTHGSEFYNYYIKTMSERKWEKLFKDDNTNILYKKDRDEAGPITLLAQKKDWLSKNSGVDMTANGWRVSHKESKLDNSRSIYFTKMSENTLLNSIGKVEHGKLIIRCLENETDAFVIFPSYIGINETLVRYRIDKNKINKENWAISTDGDTVFSIRPIKLLKSMRGGKSFIIQLDTFNIVAQELEFDITGIDDNIDKIAEYCRWKSK